MGGVVYFEGYMAELIKLQAERRGMSAEDYVLSFFLGDGCNAPASKAASFAHEVKCT